MKRSSQPILGVWSMLDIKHLKAGYNGVPVVHNVSLHVDEGRIIGLVGSNGAGKSTTLRAITGLLKPMAGDVVFKGEKINSIPAHKITARGMAMVPEGRQLFGKMSVRDNLLMGAYLIRDKKIQEESLERIYSLFPKVKERSAQLAETLSGGEQQMVAIARGMMSKPELLILDEPSLGLAPILVDEVFQFVQEINQLGITIILVEQNVNKTLQLADYAYVFQNGETVIDGPAHEMLENENIKKAYLGL